MIAAVTPRVLNRIYYGRVDVYRFFLFFTPRNPTTGSSLPPMNARPTLRPSLCALTALMALGFGFNASAQSVATTPVGAVTVTIAAGTGTVRNATIASFPLVNSVVTAGVVTGTISSVTSTSMTSAGAGWTSSDLAQASLPYVVKITSGAAVGRTFLVTANTSDTLTISTSDAVSGTAIDLSQLSILVGDKFQLENADTLLSVLGAGTADGSNAPLGNANPNLADTVQLNSANSYQTYYYDPAQSSWVNAGTEALSNNVVIRPDASVIYNRLKNTAFTITLTGAVPAIGRKSVVRSGQTTILSTFWPVDKTLTSFGLHQISGWVSSANPNLADLVQIRQSSSWQTYYHDGVNWINAGTEAVADTVPVSSGSGLVIKKRALTTAPLVLTQAISYSL